MTLPKQNFRDLIPFKKDFYIESPSVQAMPEQEALLYRTRREITVEGHDVPKPLRFFHEANFPDYCMQVIARCGFVEPTPIQAQSWPMALKGRDLIANMYILEIIILNISMPVDAVRLWILAGPFIFVLY